MSEDIEQLSDENMREIRAAGGPRFDQIEQFIQENDLVEFNVEGALNANLAFMRGLQDARSLGDRMSENQLLSFVWGQEPEIRQQTEDWLHSYLLLAYDPLEDAELDRYIEMSESAAGQDVNRALFRAYDQVFLQTSQALGRIMARHMDGNDI